MTKATHPSRPAAEPLPDIAGTALEQAHSDAIFESIGDGAIALDGSGRIRRINAAALEILGYKKSEVLGRWFPDVIVAINSKGEPIAPLERPVTRAFITGKAVNEKTWYKTPNRRIPVHVTVSPIMQRQRPIGAIEVFRDITVEHDIDRMKSDFISIASHQLRTPLSAIHTYVHMLSDEFSGKLNLLQKRYVKHITTSAQRMNEIIDTLMSISRIESGVMKAEPVVTDVSELVTRLHSELKSLAKGKKQKFSLSCDPKSIIVSIDPVFFTEICSNLLSNAIHYTPPGGKISVSLQHKNETLFFNVSDTGLGIPKELQKSIFTKFFRAPNAREIETSGSGLGLYLARELAYALGGRVWFSSQEGKGTTFYLSVPAPAQT